MTLPSWYKNQFMASKEVDFNDTSFSSPESLYFTMRFRSELLKLVNDKVVFCLYNHEKLMKDIQDGIDEVIDLEYNFKIKEKKPDADVVRNLIVGIPPQNDEFVKF